MKRQMHELLPFVINGMPKDEIILDVREADEFAEGHLKGAINIPHEEVTKHVERLRKYNKIYIHCGGGGRAGKACDALRAAGLTNCVHICDSGMRSWVEAGHPVQK